MSATPRVGDAGRRAEVRKKRDNSRPPASIITIQAD
jgi:hypothetical protein